MPWNTYKGEPNQQSVFTLNFQRHQSPYKHYHFWPANWKKREEKSRHKLNKLKKTTLDSTTIVNVISFRFNNGPKKMDLKKTQFRRTLTINTFIITIIPLNRSVIVPLFILLRRRFSCSSSSKICKNFIIKNVINTPDDPSWFRPDYSHRFHWPSSEINIGSACSFGKWFCVRCSFERAQ